MTYKRIYVKNEDKIIFKQLKHRLQVDDDIEAMHKILMIAQNSLNGQTDKIDECDGIAG